MGTFKRPISNKLLVHFSRTAINHKLIVKLMKGDNEFRQSCSANIQFGNEVYIYTTVLENFEKFINDCNGNEQPFSMDTWIPTVYYGFCGQVPGE